MFLPPLEQNRLLAALSAEERARLASRLRPVSLQRGEILARAGEAPRQLCFPVSLVAVLMATGRSGATTALALVGTEGCVGLMQALAGEAPDHDCVALMPGTACLLAVEEIPRLLGSASALLAAGLSHACWLQSQIAQTAFCNVHHSLDQRLCRWLLSIAYRLPEQPLHLTEAQIADMLGMRRESVSQATVRLREEGLIRHHRGMVEIVDRDRLEAKACECLPVFPWQPYPVTCPLSSPA
jgi:CRP-like cAMP-binding protein